MYWPSLSTPTHTVHMFGLTCACLMRKILRWSITIATASPPLLTLPRSHCHCQESQWPSLPTPSAPHQACCYHVWRHYCCNLLTHTAFFAYAFAVHVPCLCVCVCAQCVDVCVLSSHDWKRRQMRSDYTDTEREKEGNSGRADAPVLCVWSFNYGICLIYNWMPNVGGGKVLAVYRGESRIDR